MSPEEKAREIIAGYHKALGYPGGLNLAAYVGPDGLVARITAALTSATAEAIEQSASRVSALEALREIDVLYQKHHPILECCSVANQMGEIARAALSSSSEGGK